MTAAGPTDVINRLMVPEVSAAAGGAGREWMANFP
jgi:hypothetical protein